MRCIVLAAQDDGEDVPDGAFLARVLLHCDDAPTAGGRVPDGINDMQAGSTAAFSVSYSKGIVSRRSRDDRCVLCLLQGETAGYGWKWGGQD